MKKLKASRGEQGEARTNSPECSDKGESGGNSTLRPRNPESLPDWAENYLSDGKKWNKEHEKKKEEAKK